MTLTFDQNGLAIETQDEIVSRVATKLRANPLFGPNFKADDATAIAGSMVLALCESEALCQQALLELHASFDPAGAKGRVLDARAGWTGTTRDGALRSYVDGVLTFASAGTAANGSIVRNEDTGELWEITDGPHVSAGPWPETIAAQVTALEAGPKVAAAGSTWSLVTVVPGLTSFTNPTDDATKGRLRESDPDLREKRLEELYSQGQGPLEAVRGRVSKVEGVVYCRVYDNPGTFPVDADGIPFKAINVVVETQPSTPGAALQQSIWDAIWSALGGGGEAYGTDYAGTIVDVNGDSQPIAFDTITDVDIEIEVDLVTTDTETAITPNIEDIVAAKVLEVAAASWAVHGRDVRRVDVQGVVSDLLDEGTISGPYDVAVRVGRVGVGASDQAREVIGIREKPDFDSANITVAQV